MLSIAVYFIEKRTWTANAVSSVYYYAYILINMGKIMNKCAKDENEKLLTETQVIAVQLE